MPEYTVKNVHSTMPEYTVKNLVPAEVAVLRVEHESRLIPWIQSGICEKVKGTWQ